MQQPGVRRYRDRASKGFRELLGKQRAHQILAPNGAALCSNRSSSNIGPIKISEPP